MRLSLFILIFTFFVSAAAMADRAGVYPVPQSLTANGDTVVLPKVFTLMGKQEADTDAIRRLCKLLPAKKGKKGYPIYIGEKTDKAVGPYATQIPEVSGGYYLSVNPDRTVIAGYDERGTFYAVQTLSQLIAGNKIPVVEIRDYPTVAYRGVVEGFYGRPWSHGDRLRQLDFYGRYKLNVYIYGPKNDPYHSSPNWRKPYPARSAAGIKELVKVSRANKVEFVWAIHPGQDIQWNEADREALLKKFESIYQLGVRSFAVFFDDISGEGTDPVRQAELLNYIQEHFVARKPDVHPLIMCPTEYNKSWANPEPGSYLDILGERLSPSVMVMWTGDRVISDITSEGLDWVNKRIRRPAYVWWNFPVSDYVRNHLLMGPAYGLDTTAGSQMSGFVSNPMERAEASKIGVFGVANYSWNPSRYDHMATWETAIRRLLPHEAEALHTFASHNSDLGKNGHRYRRDESVEIKPVAQRFLKAFQQGQTDTDALEKLQQEYQKIAEAPNHIFMSKDNPTLIQEIQPWLEQFEVLGQAGLVALKLASLNPAKELCSYWENYEQLLRLEKKRIEIDRNNNQNPYQPGVVTGSLVMQPLIDSVRIISERRLFAQNPSASSSDKAVLPYTNLEQVKHLPLLLSDSSIAISPLLEVVPIAPHQYIGLEFSFPVSPDSVVIDLNTPGVLKWGHVETSQDGRLWQKTDARQKDTLITWTGKGEPFRYLRFCNRGSVRQSVYLKKFAVKSALFSNSRNTPFSAQDKKLSTAYELLPGNTLTLANHFQHKQARYQILAGKTENLEIVVKGLDKNDQLIELGRCTALCSEFICPPEIISLQFTTTVPKGVVIYEITGTER